jgi:hypothetical protein
MIKIAGRFSKPFVLSLGSNGRNSSLGMSCLLEQVTGLIVLPWGKQQRWLAWTCDAIDFFSVSLSVTRLQVQFHKAEASTIVSSMSPFLSYPGL